MTVVIIAIIETDKQTVLENDSFPRLLTFKLLGLNPYATNTHTCIYVNRIVFSMGETRQSKLVYTGFTRCYSCC